jgi:hypothetical protein
MNVDNIKILGEGCRNVFGNGKKLFIYCFLLQRVVIISDDPLKIIAKMVYPFLINSSIMISNITKKIYKIPFLLVVGLLLALILVSACTETSQPAVSPTSGQTPAVPVTLVTSGTPGASVTTEIPATTNIPGNPSCPSGQTLCDGSCIDTQSDSQHCGACGNVCNEEEPCSEGKCLSWTGSWVVDVYGDKYDLTQTGTLVNGTDSYNQEIFSGSTSGNPPRLTGTWVSHGKRSNPFTLDMAPDGKSFSGGISGKNIITWTREQD